MGSILIVEDRKDFADRAQQGLTEAGHFAKCVIGTNVGAIYDEIRLNVFQPTSKKWDALILDINLPLDKWGGIFLYNKLARDYRHAWDHTILFSLYAPSDSGGRSTLQSKTELDGASFILRIFADTAAIDSSNIISNKVGGIQPLVRRLSELGLTS